MGWLCASAPFQRVFLFSNGGLSKLTTFEKSVLIGELGFPNSYFWISPQNLSIEFNPEFWLVTQTSDPDAQWSCINRTFVRRCHSWRSSAAAENPAADVHCSPGRIFSVSLPSDLIVIVGEKRVVGNVGVQRCYKTGRKMPRVSLFFP